MKRFSVDIDRYQKKKNGVAAYHTERASDVKVPRAYKKSDKKNNTLGKVVDDKTVLYLCNQYLQSEYGRRGAIAVQAVHLAGTTVVIAVESALWAQEIWMHRTAIMQHINQLYGDDVVVKIAVDVR